MRRPSPAMAVAMTALFVALGGTGYALIGGGIPDGAGLFHGCANKKTGALRLVTAANQCQKAVTKGKHKRPGELAVSWSQRGPAGANGVNGTNGAAGANGTTIAARLRGTGSLTTSSSTQSFPMSSGTWSQAADEVDQLVGTVTYHAPNGTTECSQMFPGPTTIPGSMTFSVKVDGTAVGGLFLTTADGADHTTSLGLGTQFEPGSAANHTLTVEASDNCGTGGGASTAHFTVTSVKIDVLAAH